MKQKNQSDIQNKIWYAFALGFGWCGVSDNIVDA